eukprot:scaffold84443_cov60-Phaeocystis_antarctica.AAC.1
MKEAASRKLEMRRLLLTGGSSKFRSSAPSTSIPVSSISKRPVRPSGSGSHRGSVLDGGTSARRLPPTRMPATTSSHSGASPPATVKESGLPSFFVEERILSPSSSVPSNSIVATRPAVASSPLPTSVSMYLRPEVVVR